MDIIIVSHGQFGYGLIDAYERVKGKNHSIKLASFDKDDSVNFEKKLALLINNCLQEDQEILILTDITNSTPHERAINFSEITPNNIQVVSKVSLPMLIEACELMDSVLCVNDLAVFIQEDN